MSEDRVVNDYIIEPNAVIKNASLIGIDLSCANLREANLYGSSLMGSDLSGANLFNANLSSTSMAEVDLRGADLRGANLSHSFLTGADLRGCRINRVIGNGKEIKTLVLHDYIISYTHDQLAIGCQQHIIESWKNSDVLVHLDLNDFILWEENKEFIFEVIEKYPAIDSLSKRV